MPKKLIVLATSAALLAGAGLAAIPAFAATRTVRVLDNKFSPTTVTVKKGTKVKWVWRGDSPHNVSVTKGPRKFTSPVKTSGSYSKTMTRKGTYTIVCTIHLPDMTMKVKVR